MRAIFFDCFSGISGDMTVGALIDAGADFAAIEAGLGSLGVPGFSVSHEKVVKKGVTATKFHVHEEPSDSKPHRHLRHVVAIIDRGDLPEPVKARAKRTFQVVAEAEAAVHGTTIEKVHFHEVGAIDSIVDIVAAQLGMHLLGVEAGYASKIHVGSGTVRCAHGIMPVPAPATARLLEGKPIYGGEVEGELVTPTGAALLAERVRTYGAMPAMRTEAMGYGAGTKDLSDRANVLRVAIGTLEAATNAMPTETIAIVEAHVDDMPGEWFPPLIEALLDAGARDAFVTPVLGKKGRPAQCITALVAPESRDAVAKALFANSTTFGLRMRTEERFVMERAFEAVETPYGTVRVKTGVWDGETLQATPEYEDCKAAAEKAGVAVRTVYTAALAAAANLAQ